MYLSPYITDQCVTLETGTELTSLIISWRSDSQGLCPRDFMTVPSSVVVMVPADVDLLVAYLFLARISCCCWWTICLITWKYMLFLPSPSLSNKLKASLNSAIWSSESLLAIFLPSAKNICFYIHLNRTSTSNKNMKLATPLVMSNFIF